MTDRSNILNWPELIRKRYEAYLKTSFFFKEPHLRKSFEEALREGGSLLKGPYPEPHRGFAKGICARTLAAEYFADDSRDLLPALFDGALYTHQEQAIRNTREPGQNVVVATGTASGKTESFLYPILFELYHQHLEGYADEPGVRAMILYPMNALANDQRERLGKICSQLQKAGSKFKPTFGQYIGQTPENEDDQKRNATARNEKRLCNELVFREEMRQRPPHILLTNYSMLEYLLIRPVDSPLFSQGNCKHWQFIVLDEAHQYRGAKGMEMGMLIRRLKDRLREGGRESAFRCIATSATMSSEEGEDDKRVVAEFAQELFGESFCKSGIIFGESAPADVKARPRRYHAFIRALEGAFLIHKDGVDKVVLNRTGGASDNDKAVAIEAALCRECGQHYYVGQEHNNTLIEADRDPSSPHFGVEFYMPQKNGGYWLCRVCGEVSKSRVTCGCAQPIRVKQCTPSKNHRDQLAKCAACGYRRGGIGDPVQEIVHGSDGPNSVLATALHELLPEDRRKVLTFADSRQEAAFFAWYMDDSYRKLRDRNLLYRAISFPAAAKEGLSINDLTNRLLHRWNQAGLFSSATTFEDRTRQVLVSILREAMTSERRLSLEGVGLVRWFVCLPSSLLLPDTLSAPPWNLTKTEAQDLIEYLLYDMLSRRAISLPKGAGTPTRRAISDWSQQAATISTKAGRRGVYKWDGPRTKIVSHFLFRLLDGSNLSKSEKNTASTRLMRAIWRKLQNVSTDPILVSQNNDETFRLNQRWIRVEASKPGRLWECNVCASLSSYNVRRVCPRNGCPGLLMPATGDRLAENHYRLLYKSKRLPPYLRSEEHTAQVDPEVARRRQDQFKKGSINLLSSSTTFEVGVDLGDLEVVFLRNVPPESFNYTQRAGRSGRRDKPGLVITYCRRNPHDLYHFEDPQARVINGVIRPPRLSMKNEKIILRHMAAVALSAFFSNTDGRFESVKDFVCTWDSPRALTDLRIFCERDANLKRSLDRIVPEDMHERVGLANGSWISNIAGEESRLSLAQAEVCTDYTTLHERLLQCLNSENYAPISGIGRRMKTIESESVLSFLSKSAVIPKYGFPVDVVKLEVRSFDGRSTGVDLQRDLSQAIAEYAPGGKVVANKQEWKSCGVKSVPGKAWKVCHYSYDDARNFIRWDEGDSDAPKNGQKYLIPQFGFVTPLTRKPQAPKNRARRLYTTRPFFPGFDTEPKSTIIHGVRVTEAIPGVLVILCEGKNKKGFYICRVCGKHMTQSKGEHKTPWDVDCEGTLSLFALGHELVTDVVRLQFPGLEFEWETYSVAYAVLLGAAERLQVPATDLNVTIAGGDRPGKSSVILYDNVPGGAGLVAQLQNEDMFTEIIRTAADRVGGSCGCGSSCYGCLRSYRNQFAHSRLSRETALTFLSRTGVTGLPGNGTTV